MKSFVILVGILGFMVSAVCHAEALNGTVLGGESLHTAYFCGAIGLIFLTIITLKKEYPNKYTTPFSVSDSLGTCPQALKLFFYLILIYAFSSFIYLWIHGVKMKHSSGDPVTTDYVRASSGYAMAFYIGCVVFMVSAMNREKSHIA